MIITIVRYVKRFAVLLPGIFIAIVSLNTIYPNLEKRLPIGLAVFVTYVSAAYVLIPAVIRIFRIFLRPRHLPTYCVTPDGFASDPINIALIGSRQQIIDAMRAAGWVVADAHTPSNLMRQAYAVLLGRDYRSAPMSNLYLLGRKQDIGFEIQINGRRGQRHHVRFWATNYSPDRALYTQSLSVGGARNNGEQKALWFGAASRDTGFALIRHNVQITHMIHPDTNRERELIIDGLKQARKLRSVEMMRLNKPYRLVNRAWRGYLETDGIMAVCDLKPLQTQS